jgi:ribonuclease-3
MEDLRQLESRLGLTFTDKTLLQRAVIHRSYLNEYPNYPLMDNERLEFLGDAVIDFVAAEFLYNHYPEMDEGQLTRLRAALVRTESLAQQAETLDLGRHLRLGRGETANGGRNRPNTLCGAFEALIGAIYLDQGVELVRALLRERFRPVAEQVLLSQSDRDPKSLLQELTQAKAQAIPTYRIIREIGPDHSKEFSVEVRFDNHVIGEGTGRSKQVAEQAAAQDALDRGVP